MLVNSTVLTRSGDALSKNLTWTLCVIGLVTLLSGCQGLDSFAQSHPATASSQAPASTGLQEPVTYQGVSSFEHPTTWSVTKVTPTIFGYENYQITMDTVAAGFPNIWPAHRPICDLTVNPLAIEGRVNGEHSLVGFVLKRGVRNSVGNIELNSISVEKGRPQHLISRFSGGFGSAGTTGGAPLEQYHIVADMFGSDPEFPIFLVCEGPYRLKSQIDAAAEMISTRFVRDYQHKS